MFLTFLRPLASHPLVGRGSLPFPASDEDHPRFNPEWFVPYDVEGAKKLLAEAIRRKARTSLGLLIQSKSVASFRTTTPMHTPGTAVIRSKLGHAKLCVVDQRTHTVAMMTKAGGRRYFESVRLLELMRTSDPAGTTFNLSGTARL